MTIPSARSGSYPLRSGNRVRPLVDGQPAFARICAAVERARSSVWVTVAFVEQDVELAEGHGTLFDVLDRAAGRGLDVRAIFWRSQVWESFYPNKHFHGTGDQRRFLETRRPRFHARWDWLPKVFCHHQKTWLVDAGCEGETGFVGGINLVADSIVPPRHPPRTGGSTHDVYVELAGPCASDVHHNFVQRWNEASERKKEDGAWPNAASSGDLSFPTRLSPEAGDVPVQITRTVRREAYSDGIAAAGAQPFRIEQGEKSVLEAYLSAIDAAERTIYIEDQTLASVAVMERLEAALRRGVSVVCLVPARPNRMFAESRRDPRFHPIFEQLARLGGYEGFTLAGITACPAPGEYADVYVHAKIMLVDGAWGTIGSTNVADRSFHSDTEMNASFWSPEVTRGLMRELFHEHLSRDTSSLDDRAALGLFREMARANAARRARGEPLEGMAFELDPATYGELAELDSRR